MDTGATRAFRVDLGYDGTDFVGSQRQPGMRTVQGELEGAASRLTGQPVRATLAGRTDRGVHAIGQVASVRLAWRGAPDALVRALGAVTADDLVIYRVLEADDRFHARFDARWREYRYRIWRGESSPVLLRRAVWTVPADLDLPAMRAAAIGLQGRHDFASFTGAGAGTPWSQVNTTRTVYSVELSESPQCIERQDRGGGIIEVRIVADGFLPHMVRNIVGTFVEIGRGQRSPRSVAELLRERDRRLAGPPAPARGLVLWRVAYAEDEGSRVESVVGADGATGLNVDVDTDLGVEDREHEDVFAEGF